MSLYFYCFYVIASVLESGGLLTDEVSLEVAVERVRKLRLENKREDSDDEVSVDHNGESSADVTNCSSSVMVSTQGSRQLMKVSEVGTDYYRDREYKGLDPSISTDKLPDTNVVQGQSGLPVSYKYS